jgi:hypothetical protein
MLRSWRHSGFQVFVGPRTPPREEEAMEKLARCIIRASFSQERMKKLQFDFHIFTMAAYGMKTEQKKPFYSRTKESLKKY